MSTVRITTAFNVGLDFETAPFHRRMMAWIIDFVLLYCYMSLMRNLFYTQWHFQTGDAMGLDILVVTLPMLLYPLLTETILNGQTLGKKIMKIRVISLEGGEPHFGQYVMRWITRFFEWPLYFGYIFWGAQILIVLLLLTGFLGIGVLVVFLVTSRHQRLGDLIAGTAVVDAVSRLNLGDTIFLDVANAKYAVSFPQVMRLSDNDINTINIVLNGLKKKSGRDAADRVACKIKEVLNIDSALPTRGFLETLLVDYNYLATRE